MRTLLLGLFVAVVLWACGTVVPSPSPVATPLPSPTPALAYELDCGPLSGSPAACNAAVQAALRLMSLTPDGVQAVRVEAPGPTSTCSLVGAGGCRMPDVFVNLYAGSTDTLAGHVPLISTSAGWLSPAQIR